MDEQGREPVEELTLEPPTTVRTRRPRALWAVIAAVGIAAGALVVTSSDDDGGERPGLPVALAFGASGGAEAAADSSRAAWVTYVAGEDLPALGGEGTAYRLSGEVDEARVAALADALGLDGDVQRSESGWSVTNEGGLGRLDVATGAGAHWSYFAGHSDCVTEDGGIVGCSDSGECTARGGVTECTFEEVGEACPPGADCIATTTTFDPCTAADSQSEQPSCPSTDTGSDCTDDDCIAPDAGGDVPVSDDDLPEPVTPPDDVAEVALDVMAAAGHGVADAIVVGTPSGGEDSPGQWYVTVEPRLDGVASGLATYVEVSSDLRVLSADGVLGPVEGLGEYPLLDTRAAIDRANEQMAAADGIAVDGAERDASAGGSTEPGSAGTTGGTDGSSSTDVGGTDDVTVESTDSTVVDPCVAPEGASDGCGGTTDCGGDGCAATTTTIACKVQPDGREICEVDPCSSPGADPVDCPPIDCPQELAEDGVAEDDPAVGAPAAPSCTPPIDPEPVPLPEPEPVEVVLVDAERSLVLLPATDGSNDGYLVPAYRFTADDGGQLDLPAIDDEALAGTPSTDTTVPDTAAPPQPEPQPEPQPQPQPCEVLEEQGPGGESATTHTVLSYPCSNEDGLVIGQSYYVDVDTECGGGTFLLGGRIWISDDPAVETWADPGERHEGGMFTLDAEDHGTFVGNADGSITAEFRHLGQAEDIFCTPEPRP